MQTPTEMRCGLCGALAGVSFTYDKLLIKLLPHITKRDGWLYYSIDCPNCGRREQGLGLAPPENKSQGAA